MYGWMRKSPKRFCKPQMCWKFLSLRRNFTLNSRSCAHPVGTVKPGWGVKYLFCHYKQGWRCRISKSKISGFVTTNTTVDVTKTPIFVPTNSSEDDPTSRLKYPVLSPQKQPEVSRGLVKSPGFVAVNAATYGLTPPSQISAGNCPEVSLTSSSGATLTNVETPSIWKPGHKYVARHAQMWTYGLQKRYPPTFHPGDWAGKMPRLTLGASFLSYTNEGCCCRGCWIFLTEYFYVV